MLGYNKFSISLLLFFYFFHILRPHLSLKKEHQFWDLIFKTTVEQATAHFSLLSCRWLSHFIVS